MRLLLSSAKLKSVSTTLSAVAMSLMVSACGPNLGGFLPLAMDPAVKKADEQANKQPDQQPKVSTDDPKLQATPSGPISTSVPTPVEPTEETPDTTITQDLPDSPATPDAPAAPASPTVPTTPPATAPTSPLAPSTPVTPTASPSPNSPTSTPVPNAPSSTPRPTVPPSTVVTPSAPPAPSATPLPPALNTDASNHPRPGPTPSPTPSAARPPRQHQIDVPPAQQDAAIARAVVNCEKSDATSCPNNVAMLVVRGKNGLEECTAFLIGDAMMMTNSHCVPEEIKTEGADCSAHLQAFFPASGAFGPEHVSCKTILRASKIASEGTKDFVLAPDYAVFSLSHSITRPPLTLNRTGLPDNLPMRVFAVDPLSKTAIIGLLKAKDCTTAQGTLVVPAFTQNEAPVGALDNCTIIPGNSGSPALDPTGQVRALVHATVTARAASVAVTNGMAPATQQFHGIGLITNIACTNLPASAGINGGTPAAACSAPAPSRNDMSRQARSSVDEKVFDPLIQTWEATTTKSMRFTVDRSSIASGHVLMPQMVCVENPSTWLDAKASTDVIISFTLPVWELKSQIDPSYRLRLAPIEVDEVSVSVRFDADRLAKTGSAVGSAVSTPRSTRESTTQTNFIVVECK